MSLGRKSKGPGTIWVHSTRLLDLAWDPSKPLVPEYHLNYTLTCYLAAGQYCDPGHTSWDLRDARDSPDARKNEMLPPDLLIAYRKEVTMR